MSHLLSKLWPDAVRKMRSTVDSQRATAFERVNLIMIMATPAENKEQRVIFVQLQCAAHAIKSPNANAYCLFQADEDCVIRLCGIIFTSPPPYITA